MKKRYSSLFIPLLTLLIAHNAYTFPFCKNHLVEPAMAWSSSAITLQHNEIQLMANILFFSKDFAQKDLRARKFSRYAQKTVETTCQEMLNLQEKTISDSLVSKTMAALLVVSKQYKNAYTTWAHCTNYIETHKQTTAFENLLEQLRTILQKEITEIVSQNNHDINVVLVTTGKTISDNCKNIYFGLEKLVEFSEINPTAQNDVVAKVNIITNIASDITKKCNHSKKTMQAILDITERMETVSLCIFDLYYETLCKAIGTLNLEKCFTTVVFDEFGFISENERAQQLPD